MAILPPQSGLSCIPFLGDEECQAHPGAPRQADPPCTQVSHGITYYPESHQSSLQEADQCIIGVVSAVQNPEVASQQSQEQEKELDGGPSEPDFQSPGTGLYVELEGRWQCLETLGG